MKLIKFDTELNSNKAIKLKTIKRRTIEDSRYDNPNTVYELMTKYLKAHKNTEEHMYLLCMDTRMNLIGYFETAIGTVNACISNARELLQKALLANAVNVILVHNHPSGDPTPSRDDITVTKSTKQAFDLINIELADAIMIGTEYYSMKEHGLI